MKIDEKLASKIKKRLGCRWYMEAICTEIDDNNKLKCKTGCTDRIDKIDTNCCIHCEKNSSCPRPNRPFYIDDIVLLVMMLKLED